MFNDTNNLTTELRIGLETDDSYASEPCGSDQNHPDTNGQNQWTGFAINLVSRLYNNTSSLGLGIGERCM